MSQRQLLELRRTSPLTLGSSASGFQEECPTSQASVDAHGEPSMVPRGNNLPNETTSGGTLNRNWQQQQYSKAEQDLLLLRSKHQVTTVMNRGFSLLDVVRESIHLIQTQSNYFLVFTFLLVLPIIFMLGVVGYFAPKSASGIADSNGQIALCETTILEPWFMAAKAGNLSTSQQEAYYTRFQLQCSSMFQLPAQRLGIYTFRNGSITMIWNAFNRAPVLKGGRHSIGVVVAYGFVLLWGLWGSVASAWGFHLATTAIPAWGYTSSNGYTRRDQLLHHHANAMTFGKLIGLIREQFSAKICYGIIRVLWTALVSTIPIVIVDYLGTLISFMVKRSAVLQPVLTEKVLGSRAWSGINPLRSLFVLSKTVAALEPGVSGLKAVSRAVQLTKGNRWKGAGIFLLGFLNNWLCDYLKDTCTPNWQPRPPGVWEVPVTSFLVYLMFETIFTIALFPPEFILRPVFYFLCKSWRERMANMA